MKATLSELLSRIPDPPSEQWPEGKRYALAFAHGSMSVGYYAPIGADPQRPHKLDEIYEATWTSRPASDLHNEEEQERPRRVIIGSCRAHSCAHFV
jgi:hypothetical protein